MRSHIKQRTIAKTAGITESLLSLILNGKRRATPSVAAKLEAATGIKRLSWLYPDEYGNPMISHSQPDSQPASRGET